jgi:cytochrome c oxidase subunit 3
MAPILMLFISFSVAYLIRRGYVSFDVSTDTYIRTWLPIRLPWAVLFVNTVILTVSTMTIDLARRAITREAALAPIRSIPGVSLGAERVFPWLSITAVLGILFLAGQLFAWRKLSTGGFHLLGGTSSSFVYILTAMHGIHLSGGVLALIYANVAAAFHRPVEYRRIIVDITAWYWHVMTALWIYILILFALAAQ